MPRLPSDVCHVGSTSRQICTTLTVDVCHVVFNHPSDLCNDDCPIAPRGIQRDIRSMPWRPSDLCTMWPSTSLQNFNTWNTTSHWIYAIPVVRCVPSITQRVVRSMPHGLPRAIGSAPRGLRQAVRSVP
jgi:hypothetical protein